MPLDLALDAHSTTQRRLRVRIRGAVQGVGFRPYVRNLAIRHALVGWVLNDGEGVLLEIEGAAPEAFLKALCDAPPPLARIDGVETTSIPALAPEDSFTILASQSGHIATSITPDAAVCEDCLAEMFTPDDRRWLYPFLNCTHCGPRYTITTRLPYDRANTSMAPFEMCPNCASEYSDPADRRYHAQPTACPDCGPLLSHSIAEIVDAITGGKILALKGIGGFHLVCDARSDAAIARLRARKNREAKPFAVMVANLQSARRIVGLDEPSEKLLTDIARPIVLSPRRETADLANGVAPNLSEIGVMLPYAPLHYLLFHHAAGTPAGTQWLEEAQDLALVVTSANPGGEPLVIANDEAHTRLAGIADLIVTHDRDILIRADDSVMRVIDSAPAFIRRARGYTPSPIKLSSSQPSVLAFGAHLKSTICVTRGDEAFLSQHIGDLDTPAGVAFLRETVDHFLGLLDVEPEIVACDLHPDFQSTRLAEAFGKPLIRVQHHHAHIAALTAEHRIEGPLLGLSLDGYGYGEAGEAWGGEIILHDGATFSRLSHLAPLAMPGGEAAARQPWRMAASALAAIDRADDIAERFKGQPLASAVANLLTNTTPPSTSSCGRLFDAAAGLLGVSTVSRYEAEPAMQLEALVRRPQILASGYQLTQDKLDFAPLLAALADLDPADPDARRWGAELFHGTLIEGIAAWTAQAAEQTGSTRIALSGGCMLNRVLAERLIHALKQRGLEALYPRLAPPGDGAISLGQALIAGLATHEEMN